MTILELQTALLDAGFNPGPLDGVMGTLTSAALVKFQLAKGLWPDGVLGPLTEAALSAKLANPMIPGIDISHWQPNTDWAKVAASGQKFVFLKATEGVSQLDQDYQANVIGAKKAGLLVGAYHFFRAQYDGAAQAKFFLAQLHQPVTCVLDLEAQGSTDLGGFTASHIISEAQAFLDAVEAATGRVPVIYSGPGMMASLGHPKQFTRYPYWLAEYGVSTPKTAAPWTDWNIWQFTDALAVLGVTGHADGNWFKGTPDQLAAFFKV